MATISIPWSDGNGNIILTYTGQGNGTITVTTDANNIDYERRQTIHVYITDGAIREDVCTYNGLQLCSSDNKLITCLEASMKVSVEVIQRGKVLLTASGTQLVTSDGKMIRVYPQPINS